MNALRSFRSGFLPLLAAGSLLLLACAIGVHWGRSTAPQESPTVQTILRPSPSVIVAMRELSRLEGAVFHIERVVDLKEKQSRFFELFQAQDAILLVAAGDVVAGVDLAEVAEGDIRVDLRKNAVVVRLPAARVLSRRLDNERTYVHTRTTDVLAKKQENLETRARQEAEASLEQAALQGGILGQAEKSVAHTVEVLLKSLGFVDVSVSFNKGDEVVVTPPG